MRVAKTIEEIYGEAKKYDAVITTDAALATALNARIDEPRMNGFAYTARQIAAMREGFTLGRPVMSDLEIVREIRKDTDLDFKFIYSEVLNIRDIRKHTADVGKHLYSSRARKVWESYRLLPTKERSMSEYDYGNDSFFRDKKVAAIGLDLFDELDKCMNINGIDEIDLFKDGDYGIDTIYAIGNDRQIADGIVDLLKDVDPTDAAVVLDSDSPLADAVRAALYRNRIPFKNTLDVKDLSQIRDFLQFLTLANEYRTLRVSDVRELFLSYGAGDSKEGAGLKSQYDKYLLSKVPLDERNNETVRKLIGIMKGIRGKTYGEVLDEVMPERFAYRKTSVKILLTDLGFLDERVAPEKTAEIVYAVNNIEDLRHNEQIPEEEKRGVLLADCGNSVYVDRSLVIFAGMDSGWDKDTSGKDYVDPQAEAERNAIRMNVLLQQGDCRVYAVKPMTDGKPTQPCRHIINLFRDGKGNPTGKIGGFRDICREYRKGTWCAETENVFAGKPEIAVETADRYDGKFSKTSYNRYCECPLRYLYGEVLRTEDNEHTVFGSCLHDFAEMYFCYPETVRLRGTEYYLDRLNSMYSGLSSGCAEELDRSKFRIYLSNLMKFIDRIRPDEVPLDINLEDRDERFRNVFMTEEGLDKCSSLTEAGMEASEHMYAKFDAYVGSDIYDYKTGQSKTGTEIVKAFDRGSDKYLDFQPLIYLYVLSRHLGSDSASFNLFYIGDNDIESAGENFDVGLNVRRVELVGEDHDSFVLGEDSPIRRDYQAGSKHKVADRWDEVTAAVREAMGYEGWQNSRECISRLCAILSYQESTAAQILKKLASPTPVDDEGTVYVPSDAMEEFAERLGRDYGDACDIRAMPVKDVTPGPFECNKCEMRSICMAEENKADAAEEAEE